MEAMVIDPFDSDHWLYGTGASIWGGHDLTNWDVNHKVNLKSLADPLARIYSVVLEISGASPTLT